MTVDPGACLLDTSTGDEGKVPISVVLPVHNTETYVAAAIASVLRQTFSNFEFIIIDDGSTDGSLSVVRETVGSDARCRVITRGNKGLVDTLNEGIAFASGKYLFRMDADDVSHPERLARQWAYLEAHPECVALGTRALLVDDDLLPIMETFLYVTHEQIDAENMRGQGSTICHPSVAIRRDALVAVGGYRREYEWAEDLDLWLRLAEVGRLANLPEVLLTYRQHLGSVGYSRRVLQIARATAAAQSAAERRGVLAGWLDASRIVEPSGDYGSVASIHRKWAWQSLGGGHLPTARKHAWLAVRKAPLQVDNLRVLVCALRGR